MFEGKEFRESYAKENTHLRGNGTGSPPRPGELREETQGREGKACCAKGWGELEAFKSSIDRGEGRLRKTTLGEAGRVGVGTFIVEI